MFRYGNTQTITQAGPELRVRASVPGEPKRGADAAAIIDTGAMMTCVPAALIEQLDKKKLVYKRVRVGGAIGKPEYKFAYRLRLRIARCEFEDLWVLALEKDYALIGRDILNRYRIVLDGPNLVWTVEGKVCD